MKCTRPLWFGMSADMTIFAISRIDVGFFVPLVPYLHSGDMFSIGGVAAEQRPGRRDLPWGAPGP